MKLLIISCLVALAAADVSHIVDKGTGEQAAEILKQSADIRPDGFEYAYETSNGIAADASGQLKGTGEEAALAVQGSHKYTAPDGTPIQVTYVADENGYQPQGAHLPTPPPAEPIPDYIQRSIAYNEAHPEQQ